MNIRGLGCTHEGRPNQSWRREHGNKKLDLLSVLRWLQTLAVVCHVGKTTSLTYACCQTIATCCRWICLWLQCVNPALTSSILISGSLVCIHLCSLEPSLVERWALFTIGPVSAILGNFSALHVPMQKCSIVDVGRGVEFWKNYLERKIGVAIEQ